MKSLLKRINEKNKVPELQNVLFLQKVPSHNDTQCAKEEKQLALPHDTNLFYKHVTLPVD